MAAAAAPITLSAADYPDLQSAFNALPPTGGVVRIPAGTYRLKEPLVLSTAETRIEGSGAATHLINEDTSGKPALWIKSPTPDKGDGRLWRVQLANFRISGNEKSGDSILADKIEEIYLEGMSVDHHGGNGIVLRDCLEDPRVADCIITYNKQAGLLIEGNHDIVVSANHFEENLDAVRCVDAFNLTLTGNNIDDHLRHGVVIENTYGSVVTGNMIEECNGTAVILDRECYGITISANIIAHHLGGGIDLRSAWGCAVSANTFNIVHQFGVRVGPQAGRHTVSANTFSNSLYAPGKIKRPAEGKNPMDIDASSGVLLDGATHVNITGNTFSGLDTAAVWSLGKSSHLLVSSNLLTDCGRKLDKNAAWIDLNEATNTLAKDNLSDQGQR